MRSIRRVRNLAFLCLLVTLVWAGSIDLRADSGGYYCGYGDCTLLYTDCNGSWQVVSGGYYGACLLQYTLGLQGEGGGGCQIDLIDEGSYYWEHIPPGQDCGQNHCFACLAY